ncbi:hypothetical protein MWH25_04740 [Natroniella acetigena]|uniref:hypothetical protein n=1 Tax=Natroniella acetigena TaxID=52004 RepID=UPI00200A5ACF|nr:hypothetical protein [Natroniella acetigena]MCK8827053.1 hypothetical protein [Natroniella acetigena]
MSIKAIKNKYLRRRSKRRVAGKLKNLNYRLFAGLGAAGPILGGLAVQSSQLAHNFTTTLNRLDSQRAGLQSQVNQLSAGDVSLRQSGVNLAWDYEQALLELGGSGTREWTASQQQELLSAGRVRGMEGHHINSVAEHPELQAAPDNIDFLTRSEHFEAHGRDWRNSTTGDLYNREALMRRQIIKGEIVRFGQAALLGFGIAFTLSLFNQELEWQDRFEQGMEGAVIGTVGYTGGRLTGAVLTSFFGSNISSLSYIFGIGAGTSIASSLYIFYRVRRTGGTKWQSFKAASVNLGISLAGVASSSLAIWLWGSSAGIVVGVLFGGVLVGINYFKNRKLEQLINQLKKYQIALLQPDY